MLVYVSLVVDCFRLPFLLCVGVCVVCFSLICALWVWYLIAACLLFWFGLLDCYVVVCLFFIVGWPLLIAVRYVA